MHTVTTVLTLTFKDLESLQDYDYAMSQGLAVRPKVDEKNLTWTTRSDEQQYAPAGEDDTFYDSPADFQEFVETFDDGAEQADHDGEGHSWSEVTGVTSITKTYLFT